MYKVTSCLTVKSTLCPYVESILGERSRTVARIKRETFHRGVSCIEPFGEPDLEDKHHREARGVSWEDAKPREKQTSSDDNLRQMISIRRGSTQTVQKPRQEAQQESSREGSSVTKMTNEARTRPFLKRGSSVVTQQALKTSERPPLARGFSCQARTFPSITITKPHNTSQEQYQTIMEVVDEIHENFKVGPKNKPHATEEETEDEFHELIPG